VKTCSPADVAEKEPIVQRALSGVALHLQHADDGYSRRENFGGSLIHSMF